MNKEDIIRMARQSGFESNSLGVTYTSGCLPDLLEQFASLVASAEREECAKLCDWLSERYPEANSVDCSDIIRARGYE